MTTMLAIRTLAAVTGWSRGRVYNDVTETIGRTPLVRLARLAAAAGAYAEILLKLEFFNPLASVKDRVAVAMVDALEAEGRIVRGRTVLVEAASSSLGLGLAFVAAMRGYRLILAAPDSMRLEERRLLAQFGAELELTPAEGGVAAAAARAGELVRSLPDAVQPSLVAASANPLIHEMTTAEEIWTDTGGRVHVLVAGVGTGGTLTGCSRVLKPRIAGFQVVAVEPAASAVLSGEAPRPHKIQGLGLGFVPAALDRGLIDEVVKVPDDMAFEAARWLAKVEGIAGGPSTGANIAAALTVAQRPAMAGKTIVTFAPSSANRNTAGDLFLDSTMTGTRV